MTDFAVPVPAVSSSENSLIQNENESKSATQEVLKVTTRHTYQAEDTLSPTSVHPSPLEQFKLWFKAAQEDGRVFEPEAMTLCTTTIVAPYTSSASPSRPNTILSIPSSRIVLLKTVDSRGFILYTNYTSRKSKELLANPYASLTFYWREMHRQVRVVGSAEMVDRRESEEYFKSRPVGSRIGAWASRQSTVVGEGEVSGRYSKLENRFGVVKEGSSDEEKVAGGATDVDVPLPEFWGGWRIVPQ